MGFKSDSFIIENARPDHIAGLAWGTFDLKKQRLGRSIYRLAQKLFKREMNIFIFQKLAQNLINARPVNALDF